MPYASVSELPAAFKNQSAAVKRKGLQILNALLREGMDEGKAIRIALSRAKEYVQQHGKGGEPMREGGECWWDEERGAYFVGFIGETTFFVGKTDDPKDQSLCWRAEVVTDHFDKDGQWFSESCLEELAKAGSVDLLYGDSHRDAMINPASELGMAIEHTIIERDGYTILRAEGDFDTSHPEARRLWEKARKDPAKYGTSIGGWVVPEWVNSNAVHKSGKRGTEINRIDRDHYLLCRAIAARNPHTTFAAHIGKALGSDNEIRGGDADVIAVADKAWAGLSDTEVRRAIEARMRADIGSHPETGYPYVAELYEDSAIIATADGRYYKLTLSEKDGDLVVGKPKEVKRTYKADGDGCLCYGPVDALVEKASEEVEKAKWSTAYVNDLPDGAFGYIEPGGKKDKEGKTVPRGLRHYPLKDKNGQYDEAHVKNARARAMQGHTGWQQALKEIRTAYRALDLKWDRDAKGKAINPADLAEEMREVFLAVDAAEGEQMSDEIDRELSAIERIWGLIRRRETKATTDEPEPTDKADPEPDPSATLRSLLKDAVIAALEEQKQRDEAAEAQKAIQDKQAGLEAEAEKGDEGEKPSAKEKPEADKPDPLTQALEEMKKSIDENLKKINSAQAEIDNRLSNVEKARGLSRALAETTATDAGGDDEPGLETVGVDDPEFVKRLLAQSKR